MRKQYITYEQYLSTSRRINKLKANGIHLIYTRSKVKLMMGTICLGIAVFPNGLGLIFYPLSFYFFSSGGIDIYTNIENYKRKLRVLWNSTKKKVLQWK